MWKLNHFSVVTENTICVNFIRKLISISYFPFFLIIRSDSGYSQRGRFGLFKRSSVEMTQYPRRPASRPRPRAESNRAPVAPLAPRKHARTHQSFVALTHTIIMQIYKHVNNKHTYRVYRCGYEYYKVMNIGGDGPRTGERERERERGGPRRRRGRTRPLREVGEGSHGERAACGWGAECAARGAPPGHGARPRSPGLYNVANRDGCELCIRDTAARGDRPCGPCRAVPGGR